METDEIPSAFINRRLQALPEVPWAHEAPPTKYSFSFKLPSIEAADREWETCIEGLLREVQIKAPRALQGEIGAWLLQALQLVISEQQTWILEDSRLLSFDAALSDYLQQSDCGCLSSVHRPSSRPSVRPSIRPSILLSVQAFVRPWSE